MMTLQKEGQEAFLAFLWELYGLVDGDDPLQKIRAKAWDHFLSVGLPGPRNDVYRYVPLRKFFTRSYVGGETVSVDPKAIEHLILPECAGSVVVFVNGRYQAGLSRLTSLPSRLTVSSLSEAMRTYGSFLNNQWSKNLKDEADPFALANASLHRDGVFIYVAPKTVLDHPIQILNVIDSGSQPMLIMPRVQAFIGAQSEVKIVSTFGKLSGEGYAINMVADISLEDDAHVQYVQESTGIGEGTWCFDALRSTLKRNSTLKSISVNDGSVGLRLDYRASLNGENAEALLNGVWMLSGKNESHTHVLVDHQAPHCRSNQLFKGVVNDTSRSSFEGKILVRQAAQKTEAFQLNNNLLLSDRANADSKPNLEIFADDVKASHGSTVGQLDAEQIFYMKTRGFSDADAKNLLVYGYCQEVIEMIPIESVKNRLMAASRNYMSGENSRKEA